MHADSGPCHDHLVSVLVKRGLEGGPGGFVCNIALCAVLQVFSRAGYVVQIIMGLDKAKRTPCGFCFVMYHTRDDAEAAVKYVSGLTMDDRPIRVDFDWGFEEGRQYGRGRGGGQVCRHACIVLGMQGSCCYRLGMLCSVRNVLLVHIRDSWSQWSRCQGYLSSMGICGDF